MGDIINLDLSYSRITLDDVDEIKLIERNTFYESGTCTIKRIY